MTFQLDTSGRVECSASFQPLGWTIWSDFTPFTQGYIEALFASIEYPAAQDTAYLPKAFSDLAPATLARIIEDCAVELFSRDGDEDLRVEGEAFWDERQDSLRHPNFPPLTVHLGDDGKVRFAEAAATQVGIRAADEPQ